MIICFLFQAWEEKHISLEMESAGSAGFAIKGGRDQQQLPNPNAVIVTHINAESPACRHLMYVYHVYFNVLQCSLV